MKRGIGVSYFPIRSTVVLKNPSEMEIYLRISEYMSNFAFRKLRRSMDRLPVWYCQSWFAAL